MRRLLLAGLLLFVAASAQAAEEILLFDSEIVIGEDGVLTVTEAIEVRAEGRHIQRGIYRDFPIGFEDADGRGGQQQLQADLRDPRRRTGRLPR